MQRDVDRVGLVLFQPFATLHAIASTLTFIPCCHCCLHNAQVLHPINLAMMQLAYAVYQPPDALKGCLQAMGIVPNSMKVVEANVPEYGTVRTAYVMMAANQRIFVLIR